MEERIIKFIAALRSAGVRVSLAESEDAWRGIDSLGVIDRDIFRWTLRSTLVKEAEDLPTFDELFPLFFGADEQPMENPQEGMSKEEQEMLQQALQRLKQMMQQNMQRMPGDLKELLEWLLNGQTPSQEEMEQLAQRAGIDRAQSPTEAKQYAQRMQRMMGWEQLEKLLEMLWQMLEEAGMDPEKIEQLKEQVAENKGALQKQLEQYTGQAIGENKAEEYQKQKASVSDLMERPFESLTEAEMNVLRDEVRRLAARLRSRVSLRQKRGKEGRLDSKGTIRANLRYGGVPMELRFRTRRLKPRLVTFLDVSTSMRPVVEFFLRLMYLLQDQVQKSRSFAFIDHIEEVSIDLGTLTVDEAMKAILTRLPPGHYNTDFGTSLRQFRDGFMDALDSRTTMIVLGDARNNLNDPALEVFAELARRTRRTIWLNPEYPAQWGTGDSDMLKYEGLCTEVYQVRNLAQLAEAVDKMLAA